MTPNPIATTTTNAPRRTVVRPPRGFRGILTAETRLMARNPVVLAWVAALPVVASVILGAVPATTRPVTGLDGSSWFAAYQPILVMFSSVLLSVQVLPDVLTRYRETGILKRLRATPAAPSALLAAHVVLIFGIEIVVALLMVLVPATLGAPLPRNLIGFAVAFIAAAAAMVAIGMLLASAVRSNKVAGAIGTVVFFAMQFFAGLWVPRASMPDWLRMVSDGTPSGAAVGALTDAASGAWPGVAHLGVLMIWVVAPAVVSVRIFRWE